MTKLFISAGGCDFLVGRHVARAAVKQPRTFAALFHQAFQFSAYFTGKDGFHMFVVLDQVRHADDAQVRLVGLHGLAGKCDVAAALCGRMDWIVSTSVPNWLLG